MNMIQKNFTPLLILLFTVLTSLSLYGQSSVPFFTEDFGSQADFNAEWTSGGDNPGPETWTWTDDPTALFQSQPDFASETASNGYVRFNSDANGQGAHDVTLTINNPIDCSGASSVFISVQNQYGYFSPSNVSIAQIGISTDGVNFDYVTILEDVDRNDLNDAVQLVEEDISQFAAGEAQVFIQFRWQGNFEYSWAIDDIKLFDEDPRVEYDLTIESPGRPFDYATPVSQISAIPFQHAFQNNGTQVALDLMSTVDVQGVNGDTFSYTQTLPMQLQPGAIDTALFDQTFTPSDTGFYQFTYTLSSANADEKPFDNTYSSDFLISENLYSKDDGRGLRATLPQDVVDNTWEVGNYYFIENGGYQATEAIFSVASADNAHQGQSVSILLYRVNQNDDLVFDDDDVEEVGFGFYTFTDEENGDPVSAPLLNFEGDTAVVLEEGVGYFLMVQYNPDMAVVYSGLPYYYSIASVVKNGDWFTGGFGPDVTALVRMRIEEVGSVNTKEPALADNKLELFPNPVDRELTVNLTLEQINDEVIIDLLDINGRLVERRQLDNIQREQIRFQTSNLSNGTYLLRTRTAEGVRTERFVVQHR